jgi:phosphoribosylaminoimidazolecarboxamide formyltransferase/IMP cyclohydrolase
MRALVSVSDKSGIVEFCTQLHQRGVEIISTGGTFQLLQQNGVPAIPIDQVTGFPEMLDGRVKTLHPKIHGGLLAVRDNAEHMAVAAAHQIQMIDIVVVNLYPFEKTIQKPNVELDEVIENIDIGGPSMIRSAAKNYKSVAVIVNPARYDAVIADMDGNKGQVTATLRTSLALEAFEHTGRYDAIIANYLNTRLNPSSGFPATVSPVLVKEMDLRYGENPHQKAAFYKINGGKGISNFEQLHGKELSYNNLVDMDAAWQIINEFQQPAAVIIKHTNPCGCAIGESLFDAYQNAYNADPVSAFGSIIGLNRQVDVATAEEIAKTFVELVIAPSFDAAAIDILTRKTAIRLITLDPFTQSDSGPSYRHIAGGFLLQDSDSIVYGTDNEVVTATAPSPAQLTDLEFAFAIVKHVKSNAILVAKDGVVWGVGAGQMSRIDSVEIALKKAGEHAKGAVLASDAFFPFRDSVDLAAKAGIQAIVQPGGSKRDQESIDASNAHGIAMVCTGVRHFKH